MRHGVGVGDGGHSTAGLCALADLKMVEAQGMYALGLPVLRRRNSSFIHGAEDDARELMEHLADYLAHCHRR